MSQAELEEVRQEKDMFREEVQKCQITMETLRSEIGVSWEAMILFTKDSQSCVNFLTE